MFLLSLIVSTLAFAAEPTSTPVASTPKPKIQIDVPFAGATAVYNGDCAPAAMAVSASTAKVGKIAIDLATAQSICVTNEERLADIALREKAAVARAPGEANLMTSAGKALESGGNVEVVTPEGFKVAGGDHLNWKAYGTAVATNSSALGVGGRYDSRFVQPFVLDQGRAGFMAHPAVPGGTKAASPADTAKCGSAQECQAAIDQLQALAAADAAK